MFKKAKQFLVNPGKKGKIAMTSGAVLTAIMPFIAFAFANPTGGVAATQLINTVLGVVCDVFMAIGILLLAWSVGMLFLAFKNEDADSKSRAMMMMIVAIVLVAFRGILTGVLGALGTGFTPGQGIF